MKDSETVNNYYIDEAGDPVLFDKRGSIIVGREGVSKMFMVGVANLPDPRAAHQKLEGLRAVLLSDPYFKGVPSMQPEHRKTAQCFHAKDDLPEVRREVFGILPQLGVKVQVALRRKETMVNMAQALHRRGEKIRFDDFYDDLVKRLFKNLLHKADRNTIVFARRGKSVRLHALEKAIDKAKQNFERSTGIDAASKTSILPAYPSEYAGL